MGERVIFTGVILEVPKPNVLGNQKMDSFGQRNYTSNTELNWWIQREYMFNIDRI